MMRNPEEFSPETELHRPWTRQEILNRIQADRNEISQKVSQLIKPIKLDDPRIRAFKDEAAKRLRAELVVSPDRFQHVFETEFGSLYCVLETGESLRIKHHPEESRSGFRAGATEIIPAHDTIDSLAQLVLFYQEKSDIEMDKDQYGDVIEIRVREQPFGEDMRVFDLGALDSQRQEAQGDIESQAGNDGWVTYRKVSGVEDRMLVYHPGHAVTKIIK